MEKKWGQGVFGVALRGVLIVAGESKKNVRPCAGFFDALLRIFLLATPQGFSKMGVPGRQKILFLLLQFGLGL